MCDLVIIMSELFTTHEVSHMLATDLDFIKIPPFYAYFGFTVTTYFFFHSYVLFLIYYVFLLFKTRIFGVHTSYIGL